MSETISQAALRQAIAEWIGAGKQVAGPKLVNPGLILYGRLGSPDELLLEGFVRPANSIKEFLFPKQENLYSYQIRGSQVELLEDNAPATEQILIAARPCDGAALPILDAVFNWDFKDEFYNRRRAATTIVTLACSTHDDHCFCTTVGLSPSAERGSDILLLQTGDGQYEVRCLSDKGHALLQGKTAKSDQTGQANPGPAKKFDPPAVGAFARDHFEDPFWKDHALTCLGCGACAFSCPTCHCFDIVDAGPVAGSGRVRTWDTCQFATFTAHASGHNPRGAQGARQRQRILHKFSIYPEKFGEVLCTGCGNCTRNCPEGLGVLSVVTEIEHG